MGLEVSLLGFGMQKAGVYLAYGKDARTVYRIVRRDGGSYAPWDVFVRLDAGGEFTTISPAGGLRTLRDSKRFAEEYERRRVRRGL